MVLSSLESGEGEEGEHMRCTAPGLHTSGLRVRPCSADGGGETYPVLAAPQGSCVRQHRHW